MKDLSSYSPLYLTPSIIGRVKNGDYKITDEKTKKILNTESLDDWIYIYEQEVKGWFLDCAEKLLSSKREKLKLANGLVVLMICFSYFEGVEQYKQGESSDRQSGKFFRESIHKIYPGKYSDAQINHLHDQTRCGLFHDGMTRGKVVFAYQFNEAIYFDTNDVIKINPEILLKDIKKDFDDFINELKNKNSIDARDKFKKQLLHNNPRIPL
jgi:hypothetical protein